MRLIKGIAMIIYGAMFNPMSWESEDGIISLHKTKKGAKAALKKHKESLTSEAITMPWEKWCVTQFELFD